MSVQVPKILFASRDKRSECLFQEFDKNCQVLLKYQEELTKQDKVKLWLGALPYFTPHLRHYRQISICSPYAIKYRATKSFQNMHHVLQEEHPEFIFQWGATYPPYYDKETDIPFYIYTDSCCDPDDPSYPWKWRPPKVSYDYAHEQRKTFERAKKILTHSQWAKDTILKVHSINPDKIYVVGSGPAMEMGNPSFNFEEKVNRILFVGGDFKRKGVDILRKALPLVLQEIPDAEFIIIGKNTDLVLEPHPAFKLLGPLYNKAKLAEYYRTSKVFVLPSRFEPLGHVLWESMAHYTPVIVSQIGGMPETVIEHFNGYLFESENYRQLAEYIVKILKNNSLNRELCINARKHYEKNGMWYHVFQRIMNAIDKK